MNSLVVYFSKFGNTQRLAEAMAEALQSFGPVTLLSAEALDAATLNEADPIVMGSPTHNMNLPKTVRPLLDALPRRCLRGKLVAAFDTSYKMAWWLNAFTAAPRLNRKLRRLGGRPVAKATIFLVTGREGPLFDGELERGAAWAATLGARAAAEVNDRMPALAPDRGG